MVRRSFPRHLITPYILTVVLLLFTSFPAAAQPAVSGGEALKRYETAVNEQQAALEKRDSAAFALQEEKAAEALHEAAIAFEAHYADEPSVANALGYVTARRLMGDHDLAAAFAKRALDDGFDHPSLWREHGTGLLQMGSAHEADGVKALYTALERDDQSEEALATWNELGAYYIDKGMPQAADQAFSAARAIESGNVRAQLGQLTVAVFRGEVLEAGTTLTALGKTAQPYDLVLRRQLRLALKDFDERRRTFSDTAANHDAYARLLYAAARLPQAVLAAQRAARLAPEDSGKWNFLAAIQLQMGDYPGAKNSYESSLKADPNQPEVQQTVERLRQAQEQAAQQQQQNTPATGAGKGPLR